MKHAVVPLILLLASGPVLADSQSRTGVYVGGAITMTQFEDNDGGVSFDDNPLGWRVFGGYQFNRNWAVEGGYANLGTAEDQILGVDVEAEFSGFAASALGILPTSDRFELFGKLGFYSGETEVTVGPLSASEDDSGLTVGAGARFMMGDSFMIRGDFDWYDVDFDTLWSLGLGATYNFR